MPKKRRSSWGSNEDAGRGRRRIRYWADLHDGKGYRRVSETVRGTRKDADDVLARRRVEHSSDAPAPTVRQAYEMWWLPDFEDRLGKGEVSANTERLYRSMWRSRILPRWEGVQVTDVRPIQVQEWLLTLAPSSALKSLLLLSQLLDMCVRYEVAQSNPCSARYRMPKAPARERTRDVYTLEALTSVLAAVKGTPAYLPAVLCGTASCRLGEALGAKAEDVVRVESHGQVLAAVRIERQVDRSGEVLGTLKTRRSERWVVVPEPWSADVLAVGTPWLCDLGDGSPMGQAAARRAWKRALGAAGLEYVPLQNLRNSWRTFMRWELRVPEDMCEKMMGHAGKGVGEIHYDRPERDVFVDAVAEAYARYRAEKS